MSIVYFISSYRDWRQSERLVGHLLESEQTQVVIHHDVARSTWHNNGSLLNNRVHTLFHSPGVEYGKISGANLILRSLDWIERNLDYKWVVYLSEQDYPLRPISIIEDELLAAEVDCFLEAGPVEWGKPFPAPGEGFTRYHYAFIVFEDKGPAAQIWEQRRGSLSRPRNEDGQLIMPSLIARRTEGHWWVGRHVGWPFDPEIKLYGGLCWGNLNRRAVRHVLAFYNDRPDVWSHLEQTMSACEAFLQTAVCNASDLRINPDNRRLIRWEHPTDGRAGTWKQADFELLTQSGKDFGRKFSFGDEGDNLLDQLDEWRSL
jgi:hypothetical protein